MGKGGARPNSGPAPDLQALARNRDGKEWTRLPAGGRTGDIPAWPLEVEEATMEELAMWQRLWRKPQALIWEADQVHDLVALYCRVYVESMRKRATGTIIAHARVLANELLLTPDSLLRGRYVIAGTQEDRALADSVARHPAGGSTAAARPGSARDRIGAQVVPIRPEIDAPEDEEMSAEGGNPAVDPELDDDEPPF